MIIKYLCYEDRKQGIGSCVIDQHGQLVDRVLPRLPDNREKDVILLHIYMKISAFLSFSSSSREVINSGHPVSLYMLKDMLHATYKQNSFVESMHFGSHRHRDI